MEKLKAGILNGPQIRERINVWRSTEQSWTVRLVVIEVSSYKFSRETTGVRNLKSYWRVSTISGHECQSNCTFCCHTIFQRTVKIWVKSIVSAFIRKERYQSRSDLNFLTDYCRCLKRDPAAAGHRRKSLTRPFMHE